TFVEALRPLPAFLKTAAHLPLAAQKQMEAIGKLTEQLDQSNKEAQEQSEQVKVMVETLSKTGSEKDEKIEGMVTNLEKYQRMQAKQAALAVKSNELARRSQRRASEDLQLTQMARLDAMQRDQSRHFNRIEEHFRRGSKRQMWITSVAVIAAIAALALVGLFSTGVLDINALKGSFTDNSETTIQADEESRPDVGTSEVSR
ncbi:MAG: hypothetical protein OEY28_12500, partial [Nitrospira sp.]|nr:hypothetical protein [Nitrospira sp.]